jgi:UDP-glucuronate 4-epimerase
MAKILITGTAGFIGFHLANALLGKGDEIVGIDNINDYYDVNLKYSRLQEAGIDINKVDWHREVFSTKYDNYSFVRMNLEDKAELFKLFEEKNFDVVVNLAAQAGVRYSIQNPDAYIQSNIVGFLNILEAARNFPVKHLIYASSSSVYGLNDKIPFQEEDKTDSPVSLYAATKKANELMAHTYSHLYGIKTTGLRFFTVYGPWGRPDMAYFLFADAIKNGKPIKVFNHGKLKRDFTYIDDIVNGIVSLTQTSFSNGEGLYRVFNLGNDTPVELFDFIQTIERHMGKEALKEFLEMQAGDVVATWANIDELSALIGYKPATNIDEGIKRFIAWYKTYNF